jgi:hypothetical protein
MAFSDANSVTIRYALESTWGEAVANGPASTQLRVTGESFSHSKETVVTEEIDSGRQRTALLEVADSAAGGFGFELVYGEYEGFLENALRSAISSATHAIASCTVAASSILAPTGENFVASFAVGQWVKTSNGTQIAKISALTSTLLTTVGTTLVAGVVSTSVTGRTITNGTTKASYFIETDFGSIAAVKYQTGMRVNTANIAVTSQQIITGAFEFVGKQGATASTTVASAVVTSAGTNTPMTAAANVTKILSDDATLGSSVNAFSVDINNNMAPRPTVGSKFSSEPVDGGLDVTGNMNVYFDRIDFYNKLINHTSFSLDYVMRDDSDNAVIISLPEIKATTGDPLAGGKDADVFLDLQYQAIKDPTLAYTIRIDLLPA